MNESQIKKLSERIASAFTLAAGEATALAFKIEALGAGERVKSRSSLLWEWRKDDAKRLAGHFYWLAKTYERAGETGRAITFKRASNVIYEAIDADAGFNFKTFIAHPHVGLKVRLEAYDYWLNQGSNTARQIKLINAGHVDPNYPAQSPKWEG